MGTKATPSSASASAWSGKSLVDATATERLGQVILNNNLGATHSFDGLEHTRQGLGDVVTIINRGADSVTFNANGTSAAAKDQFKTAITIPPGGQVPVFYNGTQWEPTGGSNFVTRMVAFTENATNTIHTGTVPLPPGAYLEKIQVLSSALWGAAAAVLSVGDTASANGYFNAVNLKATDLLVGEVLDSDQSESWGGKQGAYLVSATGQRGPTSTNFGRYYPAGSNIVGVVTVTTPAVTTGRTFMIVTYSVPAPIAAVPSA